MTAPQFAFGMGGEDAEAVSASQGGKFARIEYFNLAKPGDLIYLRFITDSPEWPNALQHTIPTKGAPAGYTGKWPSAMPATCRYDKGFQGFYKDCYAEDSGLTDKWGKKLKGTPRVWAIACVREEVIGDGTEATGGPEMQGKRVGFRDATREVAVRGEDGKETGETVKQRRMIVVNMAYNNFFSHLQGLYSVLGTVCDRDYVVRRKGEGKDTDYDIIQMDKIEGIVPGTDRWKQYEESIKEQNIDLVSIIAERASDDYYARFFDPAKVAPQQGKEGQQAQASGAPQGAPVAQQQAASTPEVDGDALAAMRDRVRAHVPGTAPAQESAPAAAPAPASAAAAGPRDFG